jgi:hypothetical protein
MSTRITRKNDLTPSRKSPRATKKPIARTRVQNPSSDGARFLREHAGWLVLIVSAVVVGVTLFFGYRAVSASSIFQVKRVDIAGTRRTSTAAIETIAKKMTARNGVWKADLDAIRSEIERLNWVKSAVVSRVLPDALRVRVEERTPLAVVRTENGKLVWADGEARILGAVLEGENPPPFVMFGWNENEGDAVRKTNQERVALYLKLLDDWNRNEVASRISAIDLSDRQDVKAFVEYGGEVVPAFLGGEDFAARLKLALNTIEQSSQNGTLWNVEKIVAYGNRAGIVYKTDKTTIAANETKKKSAADLKNNKASEKQAGR